MVKGNNHNSKKLNRLHKKQHIATNNGVLVLCNQKELWGEIGRALWEGHWQHDFIISQESMSHLRITGVLQASYRVTLTTKIKPYYLLGHLIYFSASTELFFLFYYITVFPFDKPKKPQN